MHRIAHIDGSACVKDISQRVLAQIGFPCPARFTLPECYQSLSDLSADCFGSLAPGLSPSTHFSI